MKTKEEIRNYLEKQKLEFQNSMCHVNLLFECLREKTKEELAGIVAGMMIGQKYND